MHFFLTNGLMIQILLCKTQTIRKLSISFQKTFSVRYTHASYFHISWKTSGAFSPSSMISTRWLSTCDLSCSRGKMRFFRSSCLRSYRSLNQEWPEHMKSFSMSWKMSAKYFFMIRGKSISDTKLTRKSCSNLDLGSKMFWDPSISALIERPCS